MISGSMVALVTPMAANGEVDYEALARLVDWHEAEGTHCLVVAGTTGESATLDVNEHLEVIRFCQERVGSRVPIIAGTGANSTREAIHLTTRAQAFGVAACLLVTPYYNKPTQEGLFQHYQAVAAACPGDLILYNVPGRTAVDMSNETVLRLATIENIVGIKDATGELKRGIELVKAAPKGFVVYSGDDATAIDLILAGAKGDISVTANVAPKLMSKACELALAGDSEGAKAVDAKLSALHRDLFVEANPIPVKWALSQLGRCEATMRLPLTTLDSKFHGVVKSALKEAASIS
ncbi:4-hydroxy-tetrahydrodipicolinate synthase [Umboniibacter marinipuniceus]|uniref:4-hydroxy-tetrahydrodipicolinate synthase n=1 Tax=Umboniibacter marinipuniceus TaxID=569599 RepID=A0A3M0A8V1_9GAMM|nr:4-hydroxy-tetrahydrodipicolinate synthase [Umboniibacter marinipuniceus]RMA79238.1 dihydrodipicolinate synthase [Umboniibacter marinipuniceus]